jgi:hypothetical protein
MTESPAISAAARQYIDETLAILGDRDPFDVLEETPQWIAGVTDHLPESALVIPEAPGRWSLVEVMAHLADSDLVSGFRARMILTADRPQLPGYDQVAWVSRFEYARADPAEALHAFATIRRWNMPTWRSAQPADYARVGVHSERGDESFEQLLRMVAGHDLRHRRQITRILEVVS